MLKKGEVVVLEELFRLFQVNQQEHVSSRRMRRAWGKHCYPKGLALFGDISPLAEESPCEVRAIIGNREWVFPSAAHAEAAFHFTSDLSVVEEIRKAASIASLTQVVRQHLEQAWQDVEHTARIAGRVWHLRQKQHTFLARVDEGQQVHPLSAFLSPYSTHAVTMVLDGHRLTYPTARQAFLAGQFVDTKIRELLAHAPSPWAAEDIAHQYASRRLDLNPKELIDHQFQVQLAKALQHPEILKDVAHQFTSKKLPIYTGEDTFWGWTSTTREGKNWMGRIWFTLAGLHAAKALRAHSKLTESIRYWEY